jgi:hypothetical protein
MGWSVCLGGMRTVAGENEDEPLFVTVKMAVLWPEGAAFQSTVTRQAGIGLRRWAGCSYGLLGVGHRDVGSVGDNLVRECAVIPREDLEPWLSVWWCEGRDDSQSQGGRRGIEVSAVPDRHAQNCALYGGDAGYAVDFGNSVGRRLLPVVVGS